MEGNEMKPPVIYTTDKQEYTLEPIAPMNQWAIDWYLDSNGIRYAITVTHQFTTISQRTGITLLLGYFAFRQDTKEWLAYDDCGNYILCQPKLLLSFAALAEIAHNDLPREDWER